MSRQLHGNARSRRHRWRWIAIGALLTAGGVAAVTYVDWRGLLARANQWVIASDRRYIQALPDGAPRDGVRLYYDCLLAGGGDLESCEANAVRDIVSREQDGKAARRAIHDFRSRWE